MSIVELKEIRGEALRAPQAAVNGEPIVAWGSDRGVDSVGALFAHALRIEQEAAERYREFASSMAERDNDELAAMFDRLAEFELEDAYRLAKRAAGMALPKVSATEHAWLDRCAPVPEAHAFVYRMLTPRMALEIALREEQRAKAFFEEVVAACTDAEVLEVAQGMARTEEAHINWVNEALERVARPLQADEWLSGDPTIPQQL